MRWLTVDEPRRAIFPRRLLRIAADATTITIMLCGILIIVLPVSLHAALWLIVMAGLLDGLDGALARLAGGPTRYGKYLDVSADWIAFAAAPVKLILTLPASLPLIGALILYLIASLVRLIRTARLPRSRYGYTGVPMPGTGALLTTLIPVLPLAAAPFAVLLVASLAISRRPYPSLVVLWQRSRVPVLVGIALIIALGAVSLHTAVLVMMVPYMLFPWAYEVISNLDKHS
jgi:CDP-diacylglycerol---serine O-phosphatidyltransferase